MHDVRVPANQVTTSSAHGQRCWKVAPLWLSRIADLGSIHHALSLSRVMNRARRRSAQTFFHFPFSTEQDFPASWSDSTYRSMARLPVPSDHSHSESRLAARPTTATLRSRSCTTQDSGVASPLRTSLSEHDGGTESRQPLGAAACVCASSCTASPTTLCLLIVISAGIVTVQRAIIVHTYAWCVDPIYSFFLPSLGFALFNIHWQRVPDLTSPNQV